MNPLVGITAWRRELNTFLGPEVLQTLSASYSNAITESEMTPIIYPNGQNPATADQLVGLVDGLLVSGGDDIDPVSYGHNNESSSGQDSSVDGFEIALVRAAREQDKPVLAICRGLQLLNVALGGTIRQEVTAAGTTHELISKDSDPDELNDRRHVVHLEDDSILAGLYHSSEAKVNTLHHQGIDVLAPELVVEGRTDDGLVEAARCEGGWWALGVQWHPERLNGEHHELFAAFRQAMTST